MRSSMQDLPETQEHLEICDGTKFERRGVRVNEVMGAGVHKIFFVWYPTFFPKNLFYEMRDYYYKKMRQKSRYKIEYII